MMKDRRMGRRALLKTSAVAAGSLLGCASLAAGRALAASHEGMAALGHGGGDGYVMQSDVTQRCATCEFWGGPRRLAADGKTITVTGLGWCNNKQSPNFQKITSPEHGPMEVWKKWQVLP
jgi:hypothetical protein